MKYTVTITDEKGRAVRTYAGIPGQALRAVVGFLDRGLAFLAEAAAIKRTVDHLTGGGERKRIS